MLEFGETLFEVDPTQGSRIVTFSLEGANLLYPVETGSDGFVNGGSTLWVSPQTWPWPPSTAIDSDTHSVTVDGQSFSTQSETDTFDGNALSVSKHFSADLQAQAIDITYTLKNDGPGTAQHGLWEVSRHARGGLSFWQGPSAPPAGVPTWEFTPTEQDGVMYWDDTGGDTGKIYAEATGGWLAHVEGALLYIKVWNDVPENQHPPGQGEVEVYLGEGYIELEVQGPSSSVTSGSSSDFDIRWYVRPIPAGTDVSVGSQALVDLVNSTIQ